MPEEAAETVSEVPKTAIFERKRGKTAKKAGFEGKAHSLIHRP
jgi:hypothetical protein